MRVMGVDPGSRRIGLALSDEDRSLASPLCTVDKRGRAAAVAEIAAIARAREVSAVVVGLPLRLDGSEGPEAGRARVFGEELAAALGFPVVYWDERLTTVEAGRRLSEAGLRGEKRRAKVDRAAATIILQSYLDASARDR